MLLVICQSVIYVFFVLVSLLLTLVLVLEIKYSLDICFITP